MGTDAALCIYCRAVGSSASNCVPRAKVAVLRMYTEITC